MKLDRNKNPDGRGKYALIKLRLCPTPLAHSSCGDPVIPPQALDWGDKPDTEFFVLRLKDRFAFAALHAYAAAIQDHIDREFVAGKMTPKQADELTEYRREIQTLASKALEHPNRRLPD